MSEQRYNGTIVSGRKDGKLANSDNIFDKERGKMQSDINKEMKTRTDNSFDSLKQTKQSAEDGGENIITITRHDGLYEQVKFYNGSKGSKGDKGEQGEKGDKGEAGMQGNSGVADASNKTLVNDAITGGETDFLSAEVGKLGILTYDCSKGGTITHATLQDAINSVPTTFQKVGLSITYKSGDAIYHYTLKANTWSADPTNWFSVEDKLSDIENPWFAGGKIQYNKLTNLTKAAQSLYHAIKDIWIETDNANIESEGYYLKLGIFAIHADSLTQIKEGIKNALVCVYLTNGTDNIALSANFKINNISDKYSLETSNGTIHFILDLNDLDFSDIPATTEGYGHLILNQGLTKEYYIISKKKTSKYAGIYYENDVNELDKTNVKKTDIITSWNEVAPYLENKAVDAYQTLSIQNQFGTIEENKFINIYGKSVNDYADNANYFNPRCVSNWVPINSYTRNRYLKNLVSNAKAGVAGIALYSNFSEANFIGYYKPSSDTLQGNDVFFNVSIQDVLNSSEEFKNAKFIRFTHRKNNEGASPKTHILENFTKGFLKSDGTIFEYDGNYAVSDYILLNDDVCNLTLNGLISYTRANIYPIVFYNKNKEIIGQGYKNPADDGSTTAPIVCSIKIKDIIDNYPQASYVRFLYDTTYGIEVLTDIDINSKVVNNQDNSWCLNQFRNIICIGDSVTQGFVSDYPTYKVVPEASYPTKLGYLVTGWNITNAGRSGDSPSDWLNGNSSGKESMFRKYTFTDYDLAIIEFGYNGGLYEKDIAIEGTNTYNYDQIIKKIKEVNPNIQIVLMIPSNGIIVRNWESVINTLANNNDCKVVDLKEDLHVHLDNKKWHGNSDSGGTLDMVHFTKKGYNAKAKVVCDKLVKLFAC